MNVLSDLENNFIDSVKKNPFNMDSKYSVTIPLKRMIPSLAMYVCYEDSLSDGDLSADDFFKVAVPEFQRGNDKWTLEMQIRFIENCVSGYRPDLLLYYVDDFSNCKIIDGLQRMTAISDFLDNKFAIFSDFFYDDVKDFTFLKGISNFVANINVYQFSGEVEAVKFYIDMNENITHSSDDIDKAKLYLQSLLV